MSTLFEEFAEAERANPGFADQMLAAADHAERMEVISRYDLAHLGDHPDVQRLRALTDANGGPNNELQLDEHQIRDLFGIENTATIEHPALREMFASSAASNMNAIEGFGF